MRIDEGSYIINISRLEKDEEIEKITKEIDEEVQSENAKEIQRESLDSDGESF